MTALDHPLPAAPVLKACHCCGLVQELPPVPAGSVARCPRCASTLARPRAGGAANARTRALAAAGLVLYPLAVSLPVMRIERFGHVREGSVWTGSVSLLREGEVFVGLVVLSCSIVLPLAKLVGLLLLTSAGTAFSRAHRARTYRLIEWTGRWGMLDVLLIAVVVAWIKVGELVSVSAGPGALAFTALVVTSLAASAAFDPHALWEEIPPSAPAEAAPVEARG